MLEAFQLNLFYIIFAFVIMYTRLGRYSINNKKNHASAKVAYLRQLNVQFRKKSIN